MILVEMVEFIGLEWFVFTLLEKVRSKISFLLIRLIVFVNPGFVFLWTRLLFQKKVKVLILLLFLLGVPMPTLLVVILLVLRILLVLYQLV